MKFFQSIIRRQDCAILLDDIPTRCLYFLSSGPKSFKVLLHVCTDIIDSSKALLYYPARLIIFLNIHRAESLRIHPLCLQLLNKSTEQEVDCSIICCQVVSCHGTVIFSIDVFEKATYHAIVAGGATIFKTLGALSQELAISSVHCHVSF